MAKQPKRESGGPMKPGRWWYATTVGSVGLVAGFLLILSSADPIAIGGLLAGGSFLALSLAQVRKWISDVTEERRQLRWATKDRDDERAQAQVAHAQVSGERERARSAEAAAKARAEQAEINADQRARAAERHKQEETAACIAEEVARLRQEFEENRAIFFKQAYAAGVIDALAGRIDKIILDAPAADVIQLDEHRAATPLAAGESPRRG